jgi:hypothetical protein
MDCVRARFELLRLTPHLQCSLQGIRITHQGFQMFYGAGNELQAIGENHRLNLATRREAPRSTEGELRDESRAG